MGRLEIKRLPSAVLRKKSRKLEGVGPAEQKLFSDMTVTMREMHGIGLAAPQVGVSKQAILVDTGDGDVLKMVNPVILSKKGHVGLEEGCLSVPGKGVTVKRAEEISVSYLDENDSRRNKTFRGLTARVIQHEVDHLNGKLIIDYLPWYKKIMFRGVRGFS